MNWFKLQLTGLYVLTVQWNLQLTGLYVLTIPNYAVLSIKF